MRQVFEFFCLFLVVAVVFLLFTFLGFFPFNPAAHHQPEPATALLCIHVLYFFIVNHILIFFIVHTFNLPLSTLLFDNHDKNHLSELSGVTKTKTLENEDLRPVLVFEITKTKTP